MKKIVSVLMLLGLGLATVSMAAPRAQSWKVQRVQDSDAASFKCPSCKNTVPAVQKGHRPENVSRLARHSGEHGADCKLYKDAAMVSIDRISLDRGPNTPHR